MLTLPFGAGVMAAFIFITFELLIFPVLMDATSTLASLYIFKRARNGETIRVRALRYPLWNEALFHGNVAHGVLFLIRMVCISVPVYLQTRLNSKFSRPLVSKLIPHAYKPEPRDEDLMISEIHGMDNMFNSFTFPTEMFYRCTVVNEQGWLVAKTVNVTYLGPTRRKVQCVKDTEQVIYRRVERSQLFVQDDIYDATWVDQDMEELEEFEIRREEGVFSAFKPWPGLESEPDREFVQVKSVTAINANGLECFFWRSPVEVDYERNGEAAFFWDEKMSFFVCQNVTGKIVDFFVVEADSFRSMSSVLSNRSRDTITSKLYTVETNLRYFGSLEFNDKIRINAGNFIRQKHSSHFFQDFDSYLRLLLYTNADNYVVKVPGEEQEEAVQLDKVVFVVGCSELMFILAMGMVVKVFWLFKWKRMQTINTVAGLSRCWKQSMTDLDGAMDKPAPVTLRLKERERNGCVQKMYHPIDKVWRMSY